VQPSLAEDALGRDAVDFSKPLVRIDAAAKPVEEDTNRRSSAQGAKRLFAVLQFELALRSLARDPLIYSSKLAWRSAIAAIS
jgi:hypothetical protein